MNTTKHDRCLVIIGDKAYKIRSFDRKRDKWLSELCGYSHAECSETLVISQMLGMYRYMGWIKDLEKNHGRVLLRLYRERAA